LKDEGSSASGAEMEPEEILSEVFAQLQTATDALNELPAILGDKFSFEVADQE